jgi:hypothetical protein
MTSRTKRVALRATLVFLQWLGLTIGLGSLVMRSDASFTELISPHLGSVPMFGAAIVAGLMLGATIEPLKACVPATILMCIGAACFVAVLSYAPVADGVLLRTTGLDNYVLQRVFLVTLILTIAAVPAAIIGNLLGGSLDIKQEIAPHPEDLRTEDVTPWWEQRDEMKSGSGTEQNPA